VAVDEEFVVQIFGVLDDCWIVLDVEARRLVGVIVQVHVHHSCTPNAILKLWG